MLISVHLLYYFFLYYTKCIINVQLLVKLSALEDMLKINFMLIAIYFNIFSCVKMEKLQVSLVSFNCTFLFYNLLYFYACCGTVKIIV